MAKNWISKLSPNIKLTTLIKKLPQLGRPQQKKHPGVD